MSEAYLSGRRSGLCLGLTPDQAGFSQFIEQFARTWMKVPRTKQCQDLHGRQCRAKIKRDNMAHLEFLRDGIRWQNPQCARVCDDACGHTLNAASRFQPQTWHL